VFFKKRKNVFDNQNRVTVLFTGLQITSDSSSMVSKKKGPTKNKSLKTIIHNILYFNLHYITKNFPKDRTIERHYYWVYFNC